MNQHLEKVSRRGFLMLGGLAAAVAPVKRLWAGRAGESGVGLSGAGGGVALTASGLVAGAGRLADGGGSPPFQQDSPTVTYAIPGTRVPVGGTRANSVTVSCGVDLSVYPEQTTIYLGYASTVSSLALTRRLVSPGCTPRWVRMVFSRLRLQA